VRAMRTLILLSLAACGAHAAAPATCPPSATATAPAASPVMMPAPAAAQPPKLDDATVVAQSHAFFDAMDRQDVAAFQAAIGPSFAYYSEARFNDAAGMAKGLQNMADRKTPARTRTWDDEHVFRSDNIAVYVGHSLQHWPAEGDDAAYDEDGYSTLVWSPVGTDWKVAHASWSRAGMDAEKARWNDWLANGHGFNKKPNQLLVDTVKGKKPGKALDIAAGQGRNAVFLATQGWKTTAIDIADGGLKIAAESAAKQKVKLETIETDMDKYDYGKNKWDLVTLIYAGPRVDLLDKIKTGTRKGGLFVTEYFAADSELAKGGASGWNKDDLDKAFADGWKILKSEEVEDNADWAGQRKTKLVRFVAQKL
jgi:SAM-dependent methyltransferase